MTSGTKKEARVARKELKKVKDAEKSVRLKAAVSESNKKPRIGVDPGSIFSMKMEWICPPLNADTEGAWSWGTSRDWGEEIWTNHLEPNLVEWSKLTWGEIDHQNSDTGHKKHHNMDVSSITKEAQNRLFELEIYEDQIFRFRINNKQRLWGFRYGHKFDLLWYDPYHEIYPVDPK